MRTRNEKILLAVLVAILFFAGNYYGYKWLAQKQAALQVTVAELQADQLEAKVALMNQDDWKQRREWIKEHQPALGESSDAQAQVLQDVQKGVGDQHLEILEQSLKDVQHGPSGTQISVNIRVKGSMEGLCHWLADLQKPAKFYAVSQFSLKADQDQKSFICNLQVARYFKDGS